MLSDRQSKIINCLQKNNTWIKGSELAKIIDVTDRTVRSDINAIKKIYGEEFILSSRQLGYKFNFSNVDTSENKLIVNTDNNINGQSDRMIFIIKELLIHEQGVNIFELAEKVFVSEFTIEADLTRIKRIINDINLDKINIIRNGEIISIENNKRYTNNLLYDIAKYELQDFDIENLEKYFKGIDLYLIKSIVEEILYKHNYVSRYLSITNLIIDIAISIEQSRVYNRHKIVKNSYDEIAFDLFKLATELVRVIEEKFKVNISESSILTLANNLYRIKKIEIKENEVRKSNIEEIDTYKFYNYMLNKLKDTIQVDLTKDEKFIKTISVHTAVAIERIKLGVKFYNPLTYQLKNRFPFIFNIAINIAKEISDKYEVEFDLHETSYLVAHLASAIDKVKKRETLNVLLVVLQGPSNLGYIYDQIIKINKGSNVNIVGISSMYELDELRILNLDFDLVISTTMIHNLKCNQKITIKSSFSLADRIKVKESIQKQMATICEIKFEEIFNEFFSADLYIKDMDVSTKEEAISIIVDILKKNKYVPEEFEQSVLEREKFISTAIETGIALPHALSRSASKPGIVVGILKNAINWSGVKVRVIMLTALCQDEIECLNAYNEFITDIALDKGIVESVRKSTSLQELKEILKEFYIENQL